MNSYQQNSVNVENRFPQNKSGCIFVFSNRTPHRDRYTPLPNLGVPRRFPNKLKKTE